MKRWALALSFLCASASAQAPITQTLDDDTGHALDAFHSALARDRARISVWGASHVASDQFTSALRDALTARHGEGGPGLFFPARPLTLYDRRDVALAEGTGLHGVSTRDHHEPDDYGAAGMALDASAPARACARLAGDATSFTARARCDTDEGSLTLVVGAIRRQGWCVASHRLALAIETSTGAHEVCITLERGGLRSFGIDARNARGVVVQNLGVPGSRARDALLWNETSLARELAAHPPDLVILSYGTNESAQRRAAADLRADMRELIARFHRAAPAASCLVHGPSDRPRRVRGQWRARARSSLVRDAYRDAARAGGCAFFDLLAWTGGPGSMADWAIRGWALTDRAHFTDASYEALGRDLARAIDP